MWIMSCFGDVSSAVPTGMVPSNNDPLSSETCMYLVRSVVSFEIWLSVSADIFNTCNRVLNMSPPNVRFLFCIWQTEVHTTFFFLGHCWGFLRLACDSSLLIHHRGWLLGVRVQSLTTRRREKLEGVIWSGEFRESRQPLVMFLRPSWPCMINLSITGFTGTVETAKWMDKPLPPRGFIYLSGYLGFKKYLGYLLFLHSKACGGCKRWWEKMWR